MQMYSWIDKPGKTAPRRNAMRNASQPACDMPVHYTFALFVWPLVELFQCSPVGKGLQSTFKHISRHTFFRHDMFIAVISSTFATEHSSSNDINF